jgi:hypothetical protein
MFHKRRANDSSCQFLNDFTMNSASFIALVHEVKLPLLCISRQNKARDERCADYKSQTDTLYLLLREIKTISFRHTTHVSFEQAVFFHWRVLQSACHSEVKSCVKEMNAEVLRLHDCYCYLRPTGEWVSATLQCPVYLASDGMGSIWFNRKLKINLENLL